MMVMIFYLPLASGWFSIVLCTLYKRHNRVGKSNTSSSTLLWACKKNSSTVAVHYHWIQRDWITIFPIALCSFAGRLENILTILTYFAAEVSNHFNLHMHIRTCVSICHIKFTDSANVNYETALTFMNNWYDPVASQRSQVHVWAMYSM